jgi:hypothetical protein
MFFFCFINSSVFYQLVLVYHNSSREVCLGFGEVVSSSSRDGSVGVLGRGFNKLGHLGSRFISLNLVNVSDDGFFSRRSSLRGGSFSSRLFNRGGFGGFTLNEG